MTKTREIPGKFERAVKRVPRETLCSVCGRAIKAPAGLCRDCRQPLPAVRTKHFHDELQGGSTMTETVTTDHSHLMRMRTEQNLVRAFHDGTLPPASLATLTTEYHRQLTEHLQATHPDWTQERAYTDALRSLPSPLRDAMLATTAAPLQDITTELAEAFAFAAAKPITSPAPGYTTWADVEREARRRVTVGDFPSFELALGHLLRHDPNVRAVYNAAVAVHAAR